MRNLHILRHWHTIPLLQIAVSTQARNIRHIRSEGHRSARNASIIIMRKGDTRLDAHIETVCPVGANIMALTVLSASDLVFEEVGCGEVVFVDGLPVEIRAVESDGYACRRYEGAG